MGLILAPLVTFLWFAVPLGGWWWVRVREGSRWCRTTLPNDEGME